jgi:hypothetical protein
MAEYPVEFAWFHDDEAGNVKLARVISRGAFASQIEYRASGLDWQVLVSNDDIEFIGEYTVDDDTDDED